MMSPKANPDLGGGGKHDALKLEPLLGLGLATGPWLSAKPKCGRKDPRPWNHDDWIRTWEAKRIRKGKTIVTISPKRAF